jgi:hypothetical protein
MNTAAIPDPLTCLFTAASGLLEVFRERAGLGRAGLEAPRGASARPVCPLSSSCHALRVCEQPLSAYLRLCPHVRERIQAARERSI